MSAEMMIYIIGASIFSMAFIFMFMLLRKIEITEERILKILGEHAEEIKQAKDDEELKKLIRALPKKKRTKLKTLFESQDLQDAIKHIKKHILKVNHEENSDVNQD
ncbi:4-hydroxy-3-methylbut-2-en-1-yl diphosphate synthase [Nautilia lithotrophica]